MNPSETASARHHAYLLVGRLYLEGITAVLLPFIAEIPELADVVSRPFNADEAAAVHHRIFAYDIFPYESIFRDPSGLLGGFYAEEANFFYQKSEVDFPPKDDHIGHEISFMAALCGAESNALTNQEYALAANYRKLQHSFFRDHLLCWLPPFVSALSFSGDPFYTALGQLTLRLTYDQWDSFDQIAATNPACHSEETNLPQLAQLLQDEHTDLKQIERFLITPPACGLYLGREAIAELAREKQLPRGFGSRQQMLSNLFHSAAQYDYTPRLLLDLEEYCASWNRHYLFQIDSFPAFSGCIEPWKKLINNTSTALATMQKKFITTALSP